FSCLTTSVTQPEPNDSHATTSTLRWPSSDHSAISTAPVSDAGTMPMRQSAGTWRISRVRSIACCSLVLPTLARCERPSGASRSAPRDHPGRLAQGPEEKLGLAGRTSGLEMVVIAVLPFQIARLSVGRGGPPRQLRLREKKRKGAKGSPRDFAPSRRRGAESTGRRFRGIVRDGARIGRMGERTREEVLEARRLILAHSRDRARIAGELQGQD